MFNSFPSQGGTLTAENPVVRLNGHNRYAEYAPGWIPQAYINPMAATGIPINPVMGTACNPIGTAGVVPNPVATTAYNPYNVGGTPVSHMPGIPNIQTPVSSVNVPLPGTAAVQTIPSAGIGVTSPIGLAFGNPLFGAWNPATLTPTSVYHPYALPSLGVPSHVATTNLGVPTFQTAIGYPAATSTIGAFPMQTIFQHGNPMAIAPTAALPTCGVSPFDGRPQIDIRAFNPLAAIPPAAIANPAVHMNPHLAAHLDPNFAGCINPTMAWCTSQNVNPFINPYGPATLNPLANCAGLVNPNLPGGVPTTLPFANVTNIPMMGRGIGLGSAYSQCQDIYGFQANPWTMHDHIGNWMTAPHLMNPWHAAAGCVNPMAVNPILGTYQNPTFAQVGLNTAVSNPYNLMPFSNIVPGLSRFQNLSPIGQPITTTVAAPGVAACSPTSCI